MFVDYKWTSEEFGSVHLHKCLHGSMLPSRTNVIYNLVASYGKLVQLKMKLKLSCLICKNCASSFQVHMLQKEYFSNLALK